MGLSGNQKAQRYALGGAQCRGGAVRGGGVSRRMWVFLNGVDVTTHVQQGTVQISDELDETPNTCTLRAEAVFAARGARLELRRGSKNPTEPYYAGYVYRPTTTFIERGALGSVLTAIDDTQLLKSVYVTGHWLNTSATDVLIAIIANVPGFSSARVQRGLPTINEITITNQPVDQAISQVMARIGGYWYVDYTRHVYAFTSTSDGVTPGAVTYGDELLEAFDYDEDDSQLATRAYVEGRGTSVPGPVSVGSTTLPLEAADMFAGSGELAKIAPQGSDGGSMLLTFTGVAPGGAGAFVGPGATPASPPIVKARLGANLVGGVYKWGYTDVTGSGESLPSPVATVDLTTSIDQPNASEWVNGWGGLGGGTFPNGGTWTWGFTFVFSDGTESTPQTQSQSNLTGNSASAASIFPLSLSVPSGATAVNIYRTVNGGSTLKLSIANVPIATITAGYSDPIADGSLGAVIATGRSASISAIAVGAASVTSRKVYRTALAGSQLKLQSTIANNTATTAIDTVADGSLGANAPTSDTSGLAQPSGQVNAGSSTLIVASTVGANAGGGWALIGNMAIAYGSISGNTLAGIPTTGVGSLVAPVTYGSTIVYSPMLTGIPATGPGSITEAIVAGSDVFLVAQVDDLAAQTTTAARYTTATYTDNGVRSVWVQDRRLSLTEARARGQAELDKKKNGQASCRYATRDMRSRSGRTVNVNMNDPITGQTITNTLRLQRVTVTEIAMNIENDPLIVDDHESVGAPLHTVEASNDRFSLEDLIRQNRGLL
jgi:hypothetical protein